MTAPGSYSNDRRVVHHGGDGTWMVFDDRNQWVEYNVAQLRRPGAWDLISDLFGAFNADGGRVPGVPEGSFDDVVRALIGPPR